MKLIVLFGPPAVGKMTVGNALSKLTGLKLLHNHMTIDLVLNFFDWKTPQFKLADEFRVRLLEEIVSSDLKGVIFTYAWALDHTPDNDFINSCCDIFEQQNASIYFVELEADKKERRLRNESSYRLEQKPSKRDLKKSRKRMRENEQSHVFNTRDIPFQRANHITINNTSLSPEEVANSIITQLNLTSF